MKNIFIITALAIFLLSCSHSKKTKTSFKGHTRHNPQGFIEISKEPKFLYKYRGTSSIKKSIIKKARRNDPVDKYILKDRNLSLIVNNQECLIATLVDKFSIPANNDKAQLYYLKNRNLHFIHTYKKKNENCPITIDNNIMSYSIKAYSVLKHKSSNVRTIVLIDNGTLKIWDNSSMITEALFINQYKENKCYGDKSKTFNKYLAFMINFYGRIYAILSDGSIEEYPNVYNNVKHFTIEEKVCRLINLNKK